MRFIQPMECHVQLRWIGLFCSSGCLLAVGVQWLQLVQLTHTLTNLVKFFTLYQWFHSGPTFFPKNFFGTWDSFIDSGYQCTGLEQSLQECEIGYYGYSNPCIYYPSYCGAIGLTCQSPPPGGEVMCVLVDKFDLKIRTRVC